MRAAELVRMPGPELLATLAPLLDPGLRASDLSTITWVDPPIGARHVVLSFGGRSGRRLWFMAAGMGL